MEGIHIYSNVCKKYLKEELKRRFSESRKPPVIVCIGSDRVTGDCLGPITGELLKERGIPTFVYGTLKQTVSAKEARILGEFLKKVHPGRKILAVDAAIGKEEDVGKVRVVRGGVKPGAGANKDLPRVGDVSVMGVVNFGSFLDFALLKATKLGFVRLMAEEIAGAIEEFLAESALIFQKNG